MKYGNGQKHGDWVKLPATLDTPGFKKASDEFTFTFATAKKYLDPYINAMQARLGTFGVIFYVPCQTTEQQERILSQDPDAPEIGNPEPHILACPPISVRELAELLGGMTERNVQILEEKGLVVRVSRGVYDRDRTIAAIWKALKESETGATDVYNDERTKAMRLKRQEREIKLLESIKRLTDAEANIRAFTKLLALINSKLNLLSRRVSPRLEMVSSAEAEIVVSEEVRHIQTEISSQDVAKLVTQEASISSEAKPEQPAKKRKGKNK